MLGTEDGPTAQQADASQLAQRGAQQTDGRLGLGLIVNGVVLGTEDGAAAQQADAPQQGYYEAQQTDGRLGLGLIVNGGAPRMEQLRSKPMHLNSRNAEHNRQTDGRLWLGLELIDGVMPSTEDGAAAQQADAPQLAQRGAQQTDGRLGLGLIVNGVVLGFGMEQLRSKPMHLNRGITKHNRQTEGRLGLELFEGHAKNAATLSTTTGTTWSATGRLFTPDDFS